MKNLFQETVSVEKKGYSLVLDKKNITVFLEGDQVACLRAVSAVNLLSGEETVSHQSEATDFTFDGTEYVWTGENNIQYVLIPFDDRFEYFIRVPGKGKVDSIDYFSGDLSAKNPGSEYEFDVGFTPIPTINGARQCQFPAQESFDEFSYLTIPPLFCYIFDICGIDTKLAFGLVAERGHHNFTKFTYTTKSDNFLRRFWLSTDQCGHEVFDGTWTSPKILVYGQKSREDALKYYANYYFESGIAKRKAPKEKPRFWYGPIACGWIEQCAYSMKYDLNKSAADMANEALYNNFLTEMKERDLHPRILIIDDKWQNEYGTAVVNTDKWPDLRGWIDNNLKENNCNTMLWYKLWDAEGLPDDCTMTYEEIEKFCIADPTNPNGCAMYDGKEKRRVADPSNPKYQKILRENMHRLLSSDEGCYNAYGLKLDFAFLQPVGRNFNSYSGKYGVELYYEYLKLIYTYAKEFKPEAIISGSPCHPLFNEYIDHGRLHDYFPDLRRCLEEFKFRGMLYKTALPDALIDTDGSPFHSRRDTMRHLTQSRTIGIPDLYCITPMPSLELTPENWAQVSEAWKLYEKDIDKLFENK